MQNVTDMTYRLLFQLLFDLIQEHHVTEKKEEEPVALNAFELISRSAGLNLGNLFDSEQVWNAPDSSIVTWNVESEMCDKLKSPWFSKDIASWLLYELEFPLFFLVYFFSNYHASATYFAGIQKRNKVHIKMSTERNCTQDWGSCKTSRIWCSEEKLQGSSLQLYNNWLFWYILEVLTSW